jgi:hypothetical protein
VQLVPPSRDVEQDVAVEELVPLAGVHGVRSGAQKPDHARIRHDCLGNAGLEHGERLALLANGPGVDVVVRLAGQGLLVESVMTGRVLVSAAGARARLWAAEDGFIRTIEYHWRS